MTESRTKKVYLNTTITLIAQIAQVLLGFVVRKVFINTLGVHYLGYNSVFSNILQMLNLADMGIGVAITSYLYKPLALGDRERVAALMHMYKKIYSVMGMIVLAVGVVISFFLTILIPDADCSTLYLQILFYINLAGTVSTYYLAYNRTLLIADQKTYTTSIVDTVSYFLCSILQIAVLFLWPNYIIYLVITIGKNIISNIIVTLKVRKEYGNYDNNVNKNYVAEYKPHIIQYVKDVFISRIGAYIYYSTDNIIISIFKGSLLTGYLSNYTLVTNQINTLITNILSSIQATFGNFIVLNEDKQRRKEMVQNYFCANFFIGNFCLICLACLLQPFEKLVFGNEFVLSFSTAILLSVNLMLTILLQLPSQIFQIFKLFRYDKYIISISAALNIIISVALVGNYGIDGCLIGTFITSLVYLFSRFYIISRKVFYESYLEYILIILRYFLASTISTCIVFFANSGIPNSGFKWFAIRTILVVLEAVFVTLAFLVPTRELHFLIEKLIPMKLKKFFKKAIIIGIATLLLVMSFGLSKTYESSGYHANMGNKSLGRTDSYVEESSNGGGENKYYHFSIDDVNDVFADLTYNKDKYNSIFDNNTLNWLKSLHDEYGLVTSCYVFYENGNFNLSLVPSKYKDEFEKNSNWLRFGFHSLNANTSYDTSLDLVEDYRKTIMELKRIVGSNAIDNIVRLESFKGHEKDIKKLSNLSYQPIKGLFTADDKRKSYYLNTKLNSYIYDHDRLLDDNIVFYSTDLRIEFIKDIAIKEKEISTSAWNNQRDILIVFTHEWELDQDIRQRCESLCKWGKNNGYIFEFPEDL